MKILLLGSGGREHTLAWKIKQSVKINQLYIAPGNAGTALHGINVDIDPMNFGRIKSFVIEKDIQMV
ncbi:MAG: phosphoribosylamine--glycine ligase N-terminal domain-containing protein, partial [Bacteroidales bacterium]